MHVSELLENPKAVAFLEQKWVEMGFPVPDEPPTVTVMWRGGQAQSLQQQLEALGYVE